MDNFHFDITGQDRNAFELAMTLAFTQHKEAVAYKIFILPASCVETLELYWTSPGNSDTVLLPYQMKLEYAVNFVWGWLETVKFPPEPDLDGAVKRGFRVCSEPWGSAHSSYGEFVAVQPCWAMYHK